ncbi:MAG: N-acetyltransferase family protein [Bacteroidota bacterium]
MTEKPQPPQISTRQAREEDLPVLAVFERELAKLAFPEDPITDLSYHETKLRRALKAEPEGMIVITTSDDTDLVGWLWMTGKTALATHERYGVIRSLYVRHDLRQQGLATALATYAQRYFVSRGVHRVVAKLHINSEAGERTLNKVGFRPLHITYQWRDEQN